MREKQLKDCICQELQKNSQLLKHFPKDYLDQFCAYLFQVLNPIYGVLNPIYKVLNPRNHLHRNSTSVVSSIRHLLRTLEPELTKHANEGIEQVFNETKKREIYEIIAEQVPGILAEQERRQDRLSRFQKEILLLFRKGEYFAFLRKLEKFLNELQQNYFPLNSAEEYFKDLLQDVGDLTNVDFVHLRYFRMALNDKFIFKNKDLEFINLNLDIFDKSLSQLLALRKQLSIEESVLSHENVRQVEIIKIELKRQQINNAVCQFLKEDILDFIESIDFIKVISEKKLIEELKKYFDAHFFTYITQDNCFSMKEIIKDYLPEKPAKLVGYLSDKSWLFQFQNLCKAIIKLKEVELNKSENIRTLNKLGEGGSFQTISAVFSNSPLVVRRSSTKAFWDTAGKENAGVVEQIHHLNHPALSKVFHSAQFDGQHNNNKSKIEFMELGHGSSLTLPFNPEQLSAMFRLLVGGLRHLHQHNIVHVDVKPENIIWSDKGWVKWIDFDSAQRNNSVVDNSHIEFTNFYRSLEARKNYYSATFHKEYGYIAQDIWALGLSFFQFLTGKLPRVENSFNVEEHDEIVRQMLQNEKLEMHNEIQKLYSFIKILLIQNSEDRAKYFMSLDFDQILGITEQEACTVLSRNNELDLLKAQAALLQPEQQIAFYQSKIKHYETNLVKLDSFDEERINQHVEKYSECLVRVTGSKAKEAHIEACRATLFNHKKSNHFKILDFMRKEYQRLENEKFLSQKIQLISKRFGENPKFAAVICERINLEQYSLNKVESAKKLSKELKRKFREIKSKHRTARQRQQAYFDVLNAQFKILQIQEADDFSFNRMAKVIGLANCVLSAPDYAQDESLQKMYRQLQLMINEIKQNNPLSIVNTKKAKLISTEEDLKEIPVPEKATILSDDRQKVFSAEYWKNILDRYGFLKKLLYKKQIVDLKAINGLVNQFSRQHTPAKRVRFAFDIIAACQVWLENENNGQRYEIVNLQNAAIAELDCWLHVVLKQNEAKLTMQTEAELLGTDLSTSKTDKKAFKPIFKLARKAQSLKTNFFRSKMEKAAQEAVEQLASEFKFELNS